MDSGVVIDTTITDNVLSFIGKHEKADDVQLRLACATMPYNRILVCVFNVTSVGFEYKQNESCLVTFGSKRIRDAAFFLIIMLVTFAATLLKPQNYVSSRTIQKCVEHVSTST